MLKIRKGKLKRVKNHNNSNPFNFNKNFNFKQFEHMKFSGKQAELAFNIKV